jgi:N6-adenosine-specific RNA methylase IME4
MIFHETASIFPLMDDAQLTDLANDIRENGLLEPIWLHPDGSIIDGRNRWLACERAGVKPTFRTWDGAGSLVAFSLSRNLHRRHLSESQKSMVGANAKPILAAEARERQAHGQTAPGRTLKETFPEALGQSRDLAGKAVGVSGRLIDFAEKVKRDGVPDLVSAVERDEVAVSQAAKIANLPAEQQTAIVAKIRTDNIRPTEAVRRVTAETINKTHQEFPTGKYRVIYADPPWSYGNTQPDYHREQRDHYPVMTMRELEALPIRDMAEDNAVLFLWATSPILPEAIDLASSWGFEYKASFVWDKVKHNMGHYNSVRHEFLLVCVRGSCQPDVRTLFDSVVTEERTEHSKKPETFRKIIDTIYPMGKRVELFRRGSEITGWDAWGNEHG